MTPPDAEHPVVFIFAPVGRDAPLTRDLLQRIMQRVMAARLAVPLFNEKDYSFASKNVEWTARADTFRLVYEMKFKIAGAN